MTWGDCRIGYCQLLQRKYDCDIKGRLSSMGPVGQQDVCRMSTRIENQPQGFLPWAQGGRLGGIKQDISEVIMAGNPVTVPTAANLVVTRYICIPATLRTLISLSKQGDPQPIPESIETPGRLLLVYIDGRILVGESLHLVKMNCGHWSKVRGNKCMVKCKGS